MILAVALLACASEPGPDPVALALGPSADLAACEALAFEEMVAPCRLEFAAREAAEGRLEGADEACAGVAEPLWQQECWFQVGELLARRGRGEDALRRCARAGDFVEPCVQHLAWGQARGADEDPLQVEARARAGLAELPEDAQEPHVQALLAGHWIYALYGRGLADPAPAREAPEGQAALARTAFGLEAARLALAAGLKPDEAHARVLEAWAGERLMGPPRPPQGRLGRKARPILPQAVCALPHAPTWGGGQRLVGEDEAEDIAIAALEGLFFQPQVPAQAFVPWLSDPRPRVRWTAAKLFVLSGGPKLAPEALEGWDETQRAYIDQPDCRAETPS